MWPTYINPTVFWQLFHWPQLEFCLSSNYGQRKFMLLGFDFLCVPIVQMLNPASFSASTLHDRKAAFSFATGLVPAWGKISCIIIPVNPPACYFCKKCQLYHSTQMQGTQTPIQIQKSCHSLLCILLCKWLFFWCKRSSVPTEEAAR